MSFYVEVQYIIMIVFKFIHNFIKGKIIKLKRPLTRDELLKRKRKTVYTEKASREINKVNMVGRIKPLDELVINKIAAGEIVIAPVNALKEMMENSIDAKATKIDILVKEGGLKLLQITDNGSGIDKEDLPILCERFTTSKLETFEDLSKIETFGFRGEALASISHIARVTVTTKTERDVCAMRVSYSEGKMLGEPKPVAGKTGTIITVEDLFYNIPSRLKSFRSATEEFNKILDMIGRYAINNVGIGFTCKKFGDSKVALTVKNEVSSVDRVRIVFGANVSTKLMDFDIEITEKDRENGLIRANGLVSNLDLTNKKPIQPVFFINGRLVSCDPLRRSLYQIYSGFLPKGNKPFIYLALEIKSQNLDVNIHPTKREVRFLHEEDVIDCISLQLQKLLSSIDTSRSFKTATLSPSNSYQMHTTELGPMNQISTPLSQKVKRQENKLVRIDSTQAKITKFLRSSNSEPNRSRTGTKLHFSTRNNDDDDTTLQNVEDEDNNENEATLTKYTTSRSNTYYVSPKQRVTVNLTSIKNLKELVDQQCHSELTNIFANLTYVGIVDETRRLASIQCDLKLFLVDYGSICNELFYQIGLTDFSNFGKIILFDEDSTEEGFNLMNILKNIDTLRIEKIEEIVKKLSNMKEMLNEYFSIEIIVNDEDWKLSRIKSIPLLLKDYNPPLSKLPFFLYRLGTQVNWENEQECLDEVLKQLALFYIPPIIERVEENDSEYLKSRYAADMHELTDIMDHVIFPVIKRRLLAPRRLLKDVVEVANLPGLYKVFERC